MKRLNISDLEAVLRESFDAYDTFGPRSPKKLTPVHGYFAHRISEASSKPYEVVANGGPHDYEAKIDGAFYTKTVDIVVARQGTIRKSNTAQFNPKDVALCIGIKIISSNYHQNKNNYFEGMIGETANIQATGTPYGQIIALPVTIPYYKNSTSGGKQLDHWETISGTELEQYVELQASIEGPHRPAFIAVVLFERNYETNSIRILPTPEVEQLNRRAVKYLSLQSAWEQILGYL